MLNSVHCPLFHQGHRSSPDVNVRYHLPEMPYFRQSVPMAGFERLLLLVSHWCLGELQGAIEGR